MKKIGLVWGVFFLLHAGGCHQVGKEQAETYLTFSKIDQAQSISDGSGVTVAVIDWQFNLKGEAAEKYVHPVSMVPDEAMGQLEPWHGEWMAEIIHTIAPEAGIIPIKARGLQDKKRYESYLIQGIRYAADHGAVAVTSSMGPLMNSPELKDAIDYAEARGTVFIDVHPEYVLNEEGKKRFDTRDVYDKRIIHTGVVSVPDYPAEPDSSRDIYTWPYDIDPVFKDGWGYSNGPPIVAGVIALMKSVNRELTPGDIRSLIRETAMNLNGFWVIDGEAAVKASKSR